MEMFFVNFKATFIFQIFAIKFSKFWRVLSYYFLLFLQIYQKNLLMGLKKVGWKQTSTLLVIE